MKLSVSIWRDRLQLSGMIYASIMQSGSPLSYCSLIKDPKTVAFAVGDQLGIDTNSTLELIFRMRMESAQKVEAACNAVGGMVKWT